MSRKCVYDWCSHFGANKKSVEDKLRKVTETSEMTASTSNTRSHSICSGVLFVSNRLQLNLSFRFLANAKL